MTFTHTRLAALTTASLLTLGLVACGGDDSQTAASCAESWNADANAKQQATLVGARSVDAILDGKFRIGTWPKSEAKVPVSDSFTLDPSGEATVQKNGCLLVFPPSRLGQMAFVEAGGKWKLVATNATKFPDDARRAVQGARVATPDVLGKVKLG
jgi:hypothetical protein